MSHIVDIVFSQEVYSNNPRARTNDLINPSAMLQDFTSLEFVHDDLAFLLDCLFITADTDNQVHMWKELLSLLKNFRMTDMIHVEYSICVDPDWVVWVSTIRLYLIRLCDNLQLLVSSIHLQFFCWLCHYLDS
jgi:hypothetical protein